MFLNVPVKELRAIPLETLNVGAPHNYQPIYGPPVVQWKITPEFGKQMNMRSILSANYHVSSSQMLGGGVSQWMDALSITHQIWGECRSFFNTTWKHPYKFPIKKSFHFKTVVNSLFQLITLTMSTLWWIGKSLDVSKCFSAMVIHQAEL